MVVNRDLRGTPKPDYHSDSDSDSDGVGVGVSKTKIYRVGVSKTKIFGVGVSKTKIFGVGVGVGFAKKFSESSFKSTPSFFFLLKYQNFIFRIK